jgi:predicted transcriptional regulator
MKHKGINRQDIVELHNKGLSSNAIASELGVDGSTIREHLKRIRLGIPPLVKYDHGQIIELYKSGLSTCKIARLLGAATQTVHDHVKKEGIMRSLSEAGRLGTRKGKEHHSWKGGRIKDAAGYIRVNCPDHHRANGTGYVYEHILVWEEYHHKRLPDGFLVHHLNGIKNDNRPENLVAMKAGEHIHQSEPYKKRIRQLEIENRMLCRAFEDSQMTFYLN